jgi:hypothetical protein
MLARTCALVAIALLSSAPAFADCGDSHPGQPRCRLPELPDDRLPILTCHSFPVEDAGRMIRLSRGYGLLDVKAEVYTVNRDISVATLDAEVPVTVDDHSTLDIFDTEYFGADFYFHELVHLDDADSPNHVENYHVKTGALDADLDCHAVAGVD